MTGIPVAKDFIMDILTFGAGERLRICSSTLASVYSNGVSVPRVIVLPVPTTKDGKTVFGCDTALSEIVSFVEEGCLVAGYGIPEALADGVVALGGYIYDAELDEEFLQKNAYLTALGTVGYLLTKYPVCTSEMRVGIVGYGRIGEALARLLLFLGLSITVYSGRLKVIRALCELGICAEDYRGGADYSGLDILINTAPDRIITAGDMERFSGLGIIDLASGSYLSGIEGVIKLSGVPEKFYPVTAGRLYAEHIARRLPMAASLEKP